MMRRYRDLIFMTAMTFAVIVTVQSRAMGEQPPLVLRSQSFDRDPGWEAYNNRIVPKEYPRITQDFGYSRTHFAGRAAGEMGGVIWRAAEPAYYADKIGRKTLEDK